MNKLIAYKVPCNECPFRKDSLRGWLASYTTLELHSIVVNEKPFPCHMTHKKVISWDKAGTEEFPLCAGALRYMKQAGKMPRNKELAVLLKDIKMDDFENILLVPEFFEHHDTNKVFQKMK